MFMLNDYSCIYFMPGEKRNIAVTARQIGMMQVLF